MPDEKVPEVKILVEHRSRRQGGKLFHIIAGAELILTQKDAVKMAKMITKIVKEQ